MVITEITLEHYRKERFPVLANFGNLAEQYCYSDPNSALLKSGMIGETIVSLIFRYDHIPVPYDNTAVTRIDTTASIPNIIIQSPMGGYITPADIAKKVPKNTEDVYVRVDEYKLYYVLKNGESGDVDIWEES